MTDRETEPQRESKGSRAPVVCHLAGSGYYTCINILALGAFAEEGTVAREGLLTAQGAGARSVQALPHHAG